MITPQNRNPSGIPNLQRHQQRDRFQTVISPIDVIPHEQVVRFGTLAPDAE